jgi:hypothetical protein
MDYLRHTNNHIRNSVRIYNNNNITWFTKHTTAPKNAGIENDKRRTTSLTKHTAAPKNAGIENDKRRTTSLNKHTAAPKNAGIKNKIANMLSGIAARVKQTSANPAS